MSYIHHLLQLNYAHSLLYFHPQSSYPSQLSLYNSSHLLILCLYNHPFDFPSNTQPLTHFLYLPLSQKIILFQFFFFIDGDREGFGQLRDAWLRGRKDKMGAKGKR
jgi:hypothetical protein